MDRRAMIGHIAAKYNIKMDENDPAFLLVEMNQIALEAATRELEDRLCDRLKDTNEKLTLSLGVIATATAELNASADNIVDRKLNDLNNQVNVLGGEKVSNTNAAALSKAVDKELEAIRVKVDAIPKELRALHNKAGRRQLVAAACAGGLASLLTLAVTGWALKTSAVPVDIRVDSESVARLVINGIRQITKPTK